MLEIIIILATIGAIFAYACKHDDPTCNHEHDFDGSNAMPVFCEDILVGMYCAHPGCTVMRREEKPYAEEN